MYEWGGYGPSKIFKNILILYINIYHFNYQPTTMGLSPSKYLSQSNDALKTIYQRQRNEANLDTAPEQLTDSHSVAASAELEDSIGEELTTWSSRDQASSSKDKGIDDASEFV